MGHLCGYLFPNRQNIFPKQNYPNKTNKTPKVVSRARMVYFSPPFQLIHLHANNDQGLCKLSSRVWIKGKGFSAKWTETGKGIFTSPQGKRSERLRQESWFMQQRRNKAVLAGCKGPHTCGMPYLSIICQIYQSSFLEAFRNLKVVTKAYSSGRPCGNTSLAWRGKKRPMYQV